MLVWFALSGAGSASSAHAFAFLVAAVVTAQLIRSCWRRSAVIGSMVLAGLALRIVFGFALFWISLRHLPFMRSLQLGDGFWLLALDGRSYFDTARHAAMHGLATISPASASPAYTRLLALALRMFGESPLTAVVVNVIAYVTSCAVCTAMWPANEGAGKAARAIAIAALSFAPSVVIFSTQPLKDQTFVTLIVAIVCCLRPVLRLGHEPGRRWPAATLLLVVAGAAMYAIAGIRAYYGVLIIIGALAAMGVYLVMLPLRRWPLQIGAALAAILVLWAAFVEGAGPYAERYRRFVDSLLRVPTADSRAAVAVEPIEVAREGFVSAGGATNLAGHAPWNPAATSSRIDNELMGLLTLTVPVTLLKRLPGMAFSGGRGLLLVADLDTLFLDAIILLQIVLLIRGWRHAAGDVIYLVFVAAIGVGVMLLLAYVVTNYGTLFRLRLMYAVPLWLSGAALTGIEPMKARDPLAVRA